MRACFSGWPRSNFLLFNLHANITKVPELPGEYCCKLYLASGVTTQRDVGSGYVVSIEDRRESNEGLIVALRIFLYRSARNNTPQAMRERVRGIKELGGDGVKVHQLARDVMDCSRT